MNISFKKFKTWIDSRIVSENSLKFPNDSREYRCSANENQYFHLFIGIYSYVRNVLYSEVDEVVSMEYNSSELRIDSIITYFKDNFSINIEILKNSGIYFIDLDSPILQNKFNNKINFYVCKEGELQYSFGSSYKKFELQFQLLLKNRNIEYLYFDTPDDKLYYVKDVMGVVRKRSVSNDILNIFDKYSIVYLSNIDMLMQKTLYSDTVAESVTIDIDFLKLIFSLLNSSDTSDTTVINTARLAELCQKVIGNVYQKDSERVQQIQKYWSAKMNSRYAETFKTCFDVVTSTVNKIDDVSVILDVTKMLPTREYFLALLKITIMVSSIIQFDTVYWKFDSLAKQMYENIQLKTNSSKELCVRFFDLLASCLQLTSPMGVYYPEISDSVSQLSYRILSGEGVCLGSQIKNMNNRKFFGVCKKLSKKIMKRESYVDNDNSSPEYYYSYATSSLDCVKETTIEFCEINRFEESGLTFPQGKVKLNSDISLCTGYHIDSLSDSYVAIDPIDFFFERFKSHKKYRELFSTSLSASEHVNTISNFIEYLTCICKLCSCRFTNLTRIVSLKDIIIVKDGTTFYIGMCSQRCDGIKYNNKPFETKWMYDGVSSIHQFNEFSSKYMVPMYLQYDIFELKGYNKVITNKIQDILVDQKIGQLGSFVNYPFLDNSAVNNVYSYFINEVDEYRNSIYDILNLSVDADSVIEKIQKTFGYYYLMNLSSVMSNKMYIDYDELESTGYTCTEWFYSDFETTLTSIFDIKSQYILKTSVRTVEKLCRGINK